MYTCCFFALLADDGSVMVVDKGMPMSLECNVTFYEGVAHLLRWYRDRVIIYEQFANFQPFIHPLISVSSFVCEKTNVYT